MYVVNFYSERSPYYPEYITLFWCISIGKDWLSENMLFFVWSILIAKDLYFVKEYNLGLRWNNLDTVLSVTCLSISVEYYGNHKYIAGYLPMIT